MDSKIATLVRNIENKSIDPIEKIKCCIDDNVPYILQGGAGSGKTYTLGKIIEYIFSNNASSNVLCITYTNVAKDEIIERFPYINLEVYTIHEFCWSCINQYQDSIISYFKENLNSRDLDLDRVNEIVYDISSTSYSSFVDSNNENILKISHNDVLKLSYGVFKKYDKLKKIFVDSYPHVLVDEYQDTNKNVVKLLLEEVYVYSSKINSKVSIGFYGDPVQSIYSDGLDLSEYIYPKNKNIPLLVIDKEDNYRCSTSVINIINSLRKEIGTDDIIQKPALDNKEGEIKIIDASELDSYLNTYDETNVKILYLTHKIIAEQAGFISLYSLYDELFYKDKNDKFKSLSLKDKLVKRDKNDILISMLFELSSLVYLYESNKFNKLLRFKSLNASKLSDLKVIKNVFKNILDNKDTLNIKSVLRELETIGIKLDEDKVKKFILKETKYYKINKDEIKAPYQFKDLYNDILLVPFDELYNAFKYVYNISKYSTQHNVKGAEFDNVIVILDASDWSLYNYEGSILKTVKESIIERTSKLLYVAMSRSKDNLVLCLNNKDERLLNILNKWKEPI